MSASVNDLFMTSIAAVTTTPMGLRCLAQICHPTGNDAANTKTTQSKTTQPETIQLWIAPKLQSEADSLNLRYRIYDAPLADFLQTHWNSYDGFVFCLASGAVVRLIARYCQINRQILLLSLWIRQASM